MTCHRPLDGIDIEALAAGAGPLTAADAADHVRGCSECAGAVEAERALMRALDGVVADFPPPALSARVLRLRPFSARERTRIGLWGPPLLLAGGVFAGGLLLLAPGLAVGEQAGLLVSALASAAAVGRAALRTLADLTTVAPAGMAALSEAFRADRAIGLAALALLLPAGYGLRRALVRVRR